MNQRDFFFLIGGSLLVWFFMKRRMGVESTVETQVVEQPVPPVGNPYLAPPVFAGGGQSLLPGSGMGLIPNMPAPQFFNQQQYYNVTFQNDGNVFNPLSNEYIPLFGFIATRSYF